MEVTEFSYLENFLSAKNIPFMSTKIYIKNHKKIEAAAREEPEYTTKLRYVDEKYILCDNRESIFHEHKYCEYMCKIEIKT